MTRARDRLVLCHAQDLGGKRAAKPSRFVLEALGLPTPPKGAKGASALESIARYAPAPEPEAAGALPAAPDRPLALSHGQIDDVPHVPASSTVTRTWRRCRSPANPRTDVRQRHPPRDPCLHQHRLKGLPIDADDVIAAFESAWSSEGFLSREHEERMLAQGREVLGRFVRSELTSQAQAGRGRDRISIPRRARPGERALGSHRRRAEGIVLVDYKTSEVDEDDRAAERAKESARDGQLGLYALAYQETRGVVPARLELCFVGSGTAGSVAVEAEHLERARERIERAAAGIRAARFEANPDARTCGHCDYRQICRHSVARAGS